MNSKDYNILQLRNQEINKLNNRIKEIENMKRINNEFEAKDTFKNSINDEIYSQIMELTNTFIINLENIPAYINMYVNQETGRNALTFVNNSSLWGFRKLVVKIENNMRDLTNLYKDFYKKYPELSDSEVNDLVDYNKILGDKFRVLYAVYVNPLEPPDSEDFTRIEPGNVRSLEILNPGTFVRSAVLTDVARRADDRNIKRGVSASFSQIFKFMMQQFNKFNEFIINKYLNISRFKGAGLNNGFGQAVMPQNFYNVPVQLL